MTVTIGMDGQTEVERDKVVLERQPVFVRAFVVVRLGGHVHEERLGLADVLHAVEDAVRDHQQCAVPFGHCKYIEHAIRG
jgi:hypothetical protein